MQRRKMRGRLLVSISAGVVVLLLATPPAASQGPTISLSATVAEPGDFITVTGVECPGDDLTGSDFRAWSQLRNLTTNQVYDDAMVSTNVDGSWSLVLGIPTAAPAGNYEITQNCRYVSDNGNQVTVGRTPAALTVERPAGAPTMMVSPTTGICGANAPISTVESRSSIPM